MLLWLLLLLVIGGWRLGVGEKASEFCVDRTMLQRTRKEAKEILQRRNMLHKRGTGMERSCLAWLLWDWTRALYDLLGCKVLDWSRQRYGIDATPLVLLLLRVEFLCRHEFVRTDLCAQRHRWQNVCSDLTIWLAEKCRRVSDACWWTLRRSATNYPQVQCRQNYIPTGRRGPTRQTGLKCDQKLCNPVVTQKN